ncbi:MAG: DNA adenine methylase [Colwellia sp.]|nr:DNA adenine methylase [Colwellia sp.]
MISQYYSPLRYPGGKAKIQDYLQLLFELNSLEDGNYVEPYAGGASVALSLLFNEYVAKIHINDFDKSIHAFWHSVLNDTENLCKLILDTSINVDVWRKQKEVQLSKDEASKLDLGFSTFFLNRTNRSGILKAGIIGGYDQRGKWKMDARFNKRDLISRIQKIARYKDRIVLYNEDACKLIPKLNAYLPKNSLIYFDPPYYNKGKDLYINFYRHEDHEKISKLIDQLDTQNWVVSYDNVLAIKEMYSRFKQIEYGLSYSVGKATKGREVMIFSNGLIVPEVDNPTDRKSISRYNKAS